MLNLLLKRVVEHILGKKYFANIVVTPGTTNYDISSSIFPTKSEALAHKKRLEGTRAYIFVETISFRSHNDFYFDYRLHD